MFCRYKDCLLNLYYYNGASFVLGLNDDNKISFFIRAPCYCEVTAIGAGMLANPTSTAGVWFIGSILALVYLVLYDHIRFDDLRSQLTFILPAQSFDTIVKDLLGKGWNIINGLSVAFRVVYF